MTNEEYFKRDWFKLSPPKDMGEISSGLKKAEKILNEFSKPWSEEIPADNMAEMYAKDAYYQCLLKALRSMGFKYGYKEKRDE